MRACDSCGKPLAANARKNRRFCDACRAARRKLARDRCHEKEKLEAEKKKQETADRRLNRADIAYCRRCVYRGSFAEGYLCEYILITEKRRGCQPGAGCVKRKEEGDA